jgi:hypothetical protein
LSRPGKLYAMTFSAVSVSAAQDLFAIGPWLCSVIVHGWSLTQVTAAGDALEEVLRIETVRASGGVGATPTAPSGGTFASGQPLQDGDLISHVIQWQNATTRLAAGGGTIATLEQYGWNVREPWRHVYLPRMRPEIPAGYTEAEIPPVIRPHHWWTLSLPAAPASALTMSGTLWFEETAVLTA